ncbi:MAG: DUF2059 domain-containing protein [Thermoanaerobaculia bacterium]|nr:DUF2059 domain-containing protein [Thermoanaerobaculia bacterium]
MPSRHSIHRRDALQTGHKRLLAPILCAALTMTIAATAAASEPARRLIEMTALAHEVAFDIEQNRRQIVEQCRASEWCGVHGLEVLEAVERADQRLQLGSIAIPRVAEIFEHLDLETVQTIVEFYQSPLGRKVVELETAARTQAVLDDVAANGEEIYLRQSDERHALLESVDSISDTRALQRQLDRYAGRVVDWVAEQAQSSGQAPVEPVGTKGDRYLGVYQWLCLTYEPLDDQELQAYVDFLDSKGGSNWVNARQEVRRAAAKETARPILQQLIERLGK